jgi:hypothetical protein
MVLLPAKIWTIYKTMLKTYLLRLHVSRFLLKFNIKLRVGEVYNYRVNKFIKTKAANTVLKKIVINGSEELKS